MVQGSGGDAAAPAEAPRGETRYYEASVRLVLWRHGQTLWNVEGRFQGQSDIPLDEVGEQQPEPQVGETVHVETPDGTYKVKIIKVK